MRPRGVVPTWGLLATIGLALAPTGGAAQGAPAVPGSPPSTASAGFAGLHSRLSGGDSIRTLIVTAPADLDTTTTVGADLAGALAIRDAVDALCRGADPRERLAAVPVRSRYRERALHLAGLVALERGDRAAARSALERVAGDAANPGRRSAWLSLAGLEMDAGRWARAESLYTLADSDWRAERVARTAVSAALAELDRESEGIAYGLAASSYAASLGLEPPGAGASTLGGRRAANPDAAADTVPDDGRQKAIAHLQRFLANYPQSPGRAEIRFRLADLLLVRERDEFRAQMAERLKRLSEGLDPGPVPVLDGDGALELYRTILREDPGFSHLEAVRFNAGMLLADAGDPEAEGFLGDLLRLHPASPGAREAAVRLGDMRFARRRFREASELYARAATGPDSSLRAVATYKLGWACFRDERFLDAAIAFRDLLDLYAATTRTVERIDVKKETEAYLGHALARCGGVPTFVRLFDGGPERPHAPQVLEALAYRLYRYNLHDQALAADRLVLERYPTSAGALASARRSTNILDGRPGSKGDREALRRLASSFAPGGSWAVKQSSDSIRQAGADFARRAWLALASFHHAAARARDAESDWREALLLYDTLFERLPEDPEAFRCRLWAAEAAVRLELHLEALAHLRVAARAAEGSVRTAAAWQMVVVSDERYQRVRAGQPPGGDPALDTLARAVLAAADHFRELHPNDPRNADLAWRQGQIALAHGWHQRAAAELRRLVDRYPRDGRVPEAAALRADVLFQIGHFVEAGGAYRAAHMLARKAKTDSLAWRASEAIPICFYREAEAAIVRDSADFETHARRFQYVAANWPDYAHADAAQYRAARAWLRAGRDSQAVLAFRAFADRFAGSEFARDAQLEIARTFERQGHSEEAAAALEDFAARFARDSTAASAMLKAAQIYEAAGRGARADSMRLACLRMFPADLAATMEIGELFARRDLARIGPDLPLASLLPSTALPSSGAKTDSGNAAPETDQALTPIREPAPVSHLAAYLRLAEAHPELASRPLLAEVRFRQGEEARAAGAAIALRLPLDQSLPLRQKRLDEALAHYRASATHGVAEWAHAAACRIGAALVEFGTALEQSERPADLSGTDLQAYEEVLYSRSQIFLDRGERVWMELLRHKTLDADVAMDPWIAEARAALWSRLGLRFACRPEVEYPLVSAAVPEWPGPDLPDAGKRRQKRAERDGVVGVATPGGGGRR